MDEIITQHEALNLRLHLEVETSSRRVNTVEERIKEFEIWINEVRQSNIDTEIPM